MLYILSPRYSLISNFFAYYSLISIKNGHYSLINKPHPDPNTLGNAKPEDHWSCIAHLSAEDMLKSAVIEEKKFNNIESE